MSPDDLNDYLLHLFQLWLLYIIVAVPVVLGLLLLLKKWMDITWTPADMLLFVVPFWVYGLEIYLFSDLINGEYTPFVSVMFLLLAPLLTLFFKAISAKVDKPKTSSWFVLLFYCITATVLALLS